MRSPRLVNSARHTAEFLKRRLFGFEDRWFEMHLGIDLGGIIGNRDLAADGEASSIHAMAYQAVWCRNLRELMREAHKTEIRFDAFVDIGAGKGKACFFAHSRRSFARSVGVEFSAPLVAIANANREKIGAETVSFVNADAVDYLLPETTNLVFMFNPFDGVVMERFIANNLEHFMRRPSVIAYANDVQRHCLARFGFDTVFRNQTRKTSLYRHPAAPRALGRAAV